MAHHKPDAGPVIAYRRLMDLWYAYDHDGSPYCERVEHLSTRTFRQACHRIAQTHSGASSALPGILASVDIQHAADRWWTVCQLLESGATYRGVLFETAPAQHLASTEHVLPPKSFNHIN